MGACWGYRAYSPFAPRAPMTTYQGIEDTDTEKVRISLPTELMDRFRKVMPIYGAQTWFFRTALEEFVSQMESNPLISEQITDAIRLSLKHRGQR